MNSPRVLIFDIEIAPMLAYVWGRREQNIGLSQVKQDWFVLAWSAKWLGDPPSKIIYRDQRHAPKIEDDKRLLVPMWKLLDKADVVITQNGRRFDSRKLTARFILQGMDPTSPYQHFDTLQLVRRVADFTSNSLEYLTDKLCTKYKKLKHRNYPGMELWKACLAGDRKAWQEMKRYNIYDVLSTEELYYKIRAWAPERMAVVFHTGDASTKCRACGVVGKMQKRGFSYNRLTKIQRYQCKACKSWQNGKSLG